MNHLISVLMRFGCDATINGVPHKAFLQPLRRRHAMYIQRELTSDIDGMYLVVCEPGAPLVEGATVAAEGQTFEIITHDVHTAKRKAVYAWAILKEIGEN